MPLNAVAELVLDDMVGDIASKSSTASDNSHYLQTSNPIDWIQSEFYIPELNGPIVLHPYQRAALAEAYRKDADGKFVYSVVVWSDIKKSAKSSIAAAVALERASRLDYGSIKVVANDLKQADSRVAFYMRRALELNKRFADWHVKPSGYNITTPKRTIIEAIPVDPKGEAGGNDDLIIFSELWAANQTAAQRMWTEMTLSPTKYGYSQRWVETYAGFSGESPLLEQLYDLGVKQGRLLDVGIPGLELYANDTARLLCLWNTQPRLPWQTDDYYAQESAVLTPSEFARVHRNQWGSSESSFVPGEWWDACAVPQLPALDKYKEIAVGIDAGVSDDCFGIVAVSRDRDKIVTRFARKWTPPPGGKLQYTNPDNPEDTEYPEGVLRWLAQTFNVIVFGFDPYQLHHLCNGLRAAGVGLFLEFNQGADRLEADKALYDLIRDRRVVHDGSPDLTEHIKNANQKADPESRRLRIVKRAHKLKIDLAVCLSTAAHLAFRYLPE
jgi:phage terminase large subunit-like protein